MSAATLPPMGMILLAYRQEHFIREALLAALAQDYGDLEIVVSDDASPDGTWRIIEEEAARYRGPHRLILNRNAVNLGLMENLMTAASLTKAPYLVLAAGDDVSEAGRVRRIAETFADMRANEVPATLVISNATYIDGTGKAFAEQGGWPEDARVSTEDVFAKGMVIGGAGSAYERTVFDAFPRPDDRIYNEDAIFCQRAAMLGGIVILPERLLRYRRHGGNITTPPKEAATGHMLQQQILDHCPYWRVVLEQQGADVRWAAEKGLIPPAAARMLAAHADRHLHNLDMTVAALSSPGILRRVAAVMRQRGEPRRRQLRLLLMAVAPGLLLWVSRLRHGRSGG